MIDECLVVQESQPLHGVVELTGAKNAVLVIIASLILTHGKSVLYNVPNSADVRCILLLMQELGAQVLFDSSKKIVTIDTATINQFEVSAEIMNKMRASILVMGPLLARFGKARVALPGGCLIGARPIDYHLNGFRSMGVLLEENKPFVNASIDDKPIMHSQGRIILEYPSVGATENLMMLAVLRKGQTTIVNAAFEPEVLDLIDVLRKMGASIHCDAGAVMVINGVDSLSPIEHTVIPDRLEAGGLLLAAAITQGSLHLPNARADHLDIFLEKLKEMGHEIMVGTNAQSGLPMQGIKIIATEKPSAVAIKTGPFPGFPTDLQAPMMAMLAVCKGVSTVEETVFENRLMHVPELLKMGAQITVSGQKAVVRGVEFLYGAELIATDIRASCSLVLAALRAQGLSKITNVHHWRRGHDKLEEKLRFIGAPIKLVTKSEAPAIVPNSAQFLNRS